MLRSLSFLCVNICICILVPFSANAQGVPGGVSISIVSEPKFPEPFTSTSLTLEAYGTPILDSNVMWYINGEAYVSGTRNITFTTSELGSTTHISAVIAQGESTFSVERTITPSILTILLESSVPHHPFVREKMGIPAETPFTAIALLNNGKTNASYNYSWELGEGNAGTIKGQRISLTMPLYETLLSLTITDEHGTLIHRSGTYLTPRTPHLSLYSYLNTIASPFPLENTYTPLRDTETFLGVVRHSAQANIQWFLNTTPLTAPENPNILTFSQLLTARATLRIAIPYGPFNTLTAQRTILISQ